MNNRLKKDNLDPYFVGYSILIKGLDEKNFYDGISKSLFIIKLFTSSSDVILYKLKDDGVYYHFNNSNELSQNIDYVNRIINYKELNINNQEYLKIQNGNINKLVVIPISYDNHNYSLVLLDSIIDDDQLKILIGVLKKTLTIILSKMDMYQDIRKKGEKDALTGLDNRLVYNSMIEYLKNNSNQPFSFAILDLFRLKYVNDHLGYAYGDMYIKECAEIIKSYFPKYHLSKDNNGNITKIKTGDQVFRIGGDEFAVISTEKSQYELSNIIEYFTNNVTITLPTEEDLILKINYGISERKSDENPEDVFKRANDNLSNNKKIMYIKERIERRR